MTSLQTTLPVAPVRPVRDDTGGLSFDDPYLWLEDDTDDEVLAWQAAQDAAAQDYQLSWPDYSALRSRVEQLMVDPMRFAPQPVGEQWFRTVDPGVGRLVVVEVADRPDGQTWRPVFDVREHSEDPSAHVLAFARGPRTLRCIAMGRAPESFFVDLEEGVRERTEYRTDVFPLADGRRLVSELSAPAGRRISTVWLEDADGRAEEPIVVEDLETALHLSADGTVAWIEVGHLSPRPAYVRRLDGAAGWQPFVGDGDFYVRGFAERDGFTAITTLGAPRARLVSIPLDAGDDPARWVELVPEGDAIPVTVARVGDRLVLAEMLDGASRLRVLEPTGQEVGEIVLPERGSVNGFSSGGLFTTMFDTFHAGTDTITFMFQSHSRSSAVWVADPRTCEARPLEPATALTGLVTELGRATSSDGADVTYTIVRRQDLSPDVPRPTLVLGYGGFMISHLPDFLGAFAAFVEAGGTVVDCNLRGGGEYGPDWWQQGRMHTKQQTFDDLYAVVEHLVAAGVADASRVAVHGRSNGGLLAAVAAVQRPDLFRVVSARVPVVDLNGIARHPVGLVAVLDEYGDPNDPTDAAVLAAYNPYRNVTDGTAYPTVLLNAGADDPTCPPWHSRKLAARLQAATSSSHPVLLRVWQDAQHGTGERDVVVDWHAGEVSVLMRELGMSYPPVAD